MNEYKIVLKVVVIPTSFQSVDGKPMLPFDRFFVERCRALDREVALSFTIPHLLRQFLAQINDGSRLTGHDHHVSEAQVYERPGPHSAWKELTSWGEVWTMKSAHPHESKDK